jgi:methylphosphonate synthase
MLKDRPQATATRTVNEDSEDAYLKALGARVLGEANDLKRTPEILASELGFDAAVVDAVIAGQADEHTAQQLLRAMAARYPIELGDLLVAPDDTEKGVRTLSAMDSTASARIIRRPDRTGTQQPYYEYRDTAMSRHAPFRPEWIKQLRHVKDSDAANPDVAYNRGHLLHQFTFFLGPVNFYWEVGGKRYCAELDDGDSSYITPLVPHSFATRDPSREAIIVAVAYRTYSSRAVADLPYLGSGEIAELAGDLRHAESVFAARLRRHLDAESSSIEQLEDRLVERGWDRLRAATVIRNGPRSEEEMRILAAVLNVRVTDLAVQSLLINEEVVVHRRRDARSHNYPDDTAPTYRLTQLARTKHQPYLKAFDLEVIDREGGALRHSLHEYAYNYGATPVRLKWDTQRERVIEPGGSAYIRPFVTHSFALEPRSSSAKLLIVRIPGLLDDDVTTELAGLDPNGRARAAGESTVWF